MATFAFGDLFSRAVTLPLLLGFLLLHPSVAWNAIIPGHYIVELRTPSLAEPAATRSAPVFSRRARLREEQGQVRGQIEARGALVHGAAENVVNALFVESHRENARAELAAIPGVKRVLPAREFHRVMDRAVEVNGIAAAWSRVGAERAGEGVKVAVIDSGIEAGHAAFQTAAIRPPEGYPRVDAGEEPAGITNNKIIVARSYVSLLRRRDPDQSARDRVGHGTALAAVIAGTRVAGPLATISGVAPGAFIGNYKVFGSPGVNDGATDAAILKAIDDAVADGMDIINLSLGSDYAPRLEDDLEVEAVERATRAGVLVVVSAGNNGPGLNTLSSPGTAPSALTVGSVTNGRVFAASAEMPGGVSHLAIPGSGTNPTVPLTAPVVDVFALGSAGGLGCESLPANSLRGAIALILRGTCTFEAKLNNAQAAGAVAGLIFAAEAAPAAAGMLVGSATLPSMMISHGDGLAVRKAVEESGGGAPVLTLRFTVGPVNVAAGRRSAFSAGGPSVDSSFKPDLVAVGSNVYVPTQTLDQAGDMYDGSGFLVVSGTSFSAPIVAGSAALLKAARPGLTVGQYRSLLMNTTADASGQRGEVATFQQTGAGLLNVAAGLDATITAVPAALQFGAGGNSLDASVPLRLANLSDRQDTFAIEADVRGGASAPSAPAAVTVPAGGSVEAAVVWKASDLAAGAQQGYLSVRSLNTGSTIRVPYWYAVKSATPAGFTVLDSTLTGRRGATVRDALLFRVLDSSGLNVEGAQPEVTVKSGDGLARPVVSYDADIPGMFGLTVQLGLNPGANVFEIKAGEVTYEFTVTGQ